ncbi:hypothetical protein [Bradyrhizobium japonicum]|uniref:hypothetical protein n=1 Tax=Bradyrhizobium japonicum TaxID=375 RepID=UPI001CEC3400|nr:hypothetical protein [Bradyrhizobium japonicum]MDH6177255.1 hypothetical protein [Bradyrhizobium japonicum]
MRYFTFEAGRAVTSSRTFALEHWLLQIAVEKAAFMSTRLSLLCVHGVGHAEIDAEFRKSWSEAIIRAVQSVDQSLNPAIDFLSYDDLFDKSPPNLVTYGIALAKLLASATVHGIGDLLAGTRGLDDVPTLIRWTAGMVAQWSVDEQLQAALRGAVLDKLKSGNYDVVLAHSLGSLICYDTFVRNPAAIRDKVFVTFGSQIGNPAVRDIFAGRIQDLPCRIGTICSTGKIAFSPIRSRSPQTTSSRC